MLILEIYKHRYDSIIIIILFDLKFYLIRKNTYDFWIQYKNLSKNQLLINSSLKTSRASEIDNQ